MDAKLSADLGKEDAAVVAVNLEVSEVLIPQSVE